MKRSKTQAVYRFLPEMWISEKDDSERAVSAKIKNWNYIKMSDIYEDFIEGEIKRQIKLFGDRGGDISAFDLSPDTHSFSIVETACNEGIPDIIGEISPLVFYCSSCGAVSDLRNPDAVDKYTWKCKNPDCGKWAVKQLQMIYACECGYAQPIKIPHVQGVKNFKFRPNETQYKMFYRSGNSEKPAEFVQICPNCNTRLLEAGKKLEGMEIVCHDFSDISTKIVARDLIFLDPPYTVSKEDTGFVGYNSTWFSLDDQHRLAKLIDQIKKAGAYYIMTNAAHETILEIFKDKGRMVTLERNSLIGGKKAYRGKVPEYIFTNIPERSTK